MEKWPHVRSLPEISWFHFLTVKYARVSEDDGVSAPTVRPTAWEGGLSASSSQPHVITSDNTDGPWWPL